MNFFSKAKNNYRIAQAFSLFRYMGDALVYTFLALFFHSLNLSALETGTLLASVPVMAIIGNVIMSLLSKSVRYNMILLKIIMPLEIVGMVAIGFFTTFIPVLLCSILMNLCNSCFYSLFDGLAGDISTKTGKNYAGIRVFGSIAYFIASFSGGFIIKYIDYKYTFIVAGGIYLLAYLVLYFIQSEKLSADSQKDKPTGFLVYLVHNKIYVLYFFFYIFLLSMSNATDSFFSLYAKEANNMPENIYGIVYASMILIEIIVMFLSIYFKQRNRKFMIVIASAFLLTRTILLCFNLPYFMLFIIPIFRGLGWGLILALHLNTLRTIVKKEYLTKSIFIITIGMQIINTIFNQFGPIIVSHTSYNIFFSILLGSGAIGFFFLLITPLRSAKADSKQEMSSKQ